MATRSILNPVSAVSTRLVTLLFVLILSVSESQAVSAQSAVRFEKSKGMVVVPVFINGQGPFRFVLDTGASVCLIDESLARELALQSRSKTTMMSAAGVTEVPVYRMDNLKLGDFEALNVLAGAVAPNTEILTSRKARGFLGLSFLNRFNFLLDYKNQSITFDTGLTVESSNEGVYSLDRSQGLCVVLLPVGDVVARFIVDSGADGLMLFTTAHFPYARVTSTSVVHTPYGERQVSRAEISGLRIGKRTLNKEKVTILTGQGPEGCDGLLPARMFSSLYFDNLRDRLVVNPAPLDGSRVSVNGTSNPANGQAEDQVPFELRDAHLILVKGSLQGIDRKVKLLIDTGATATYVNRKLARRAGLRTLPDMGIESSAFGFNLKVERVLVRGLQLGRRLISRSCLAVDLPWEDIDIVVGVDILRTTSLTIDYARSKLVFGGPSINEPSTTIENEEGLLVIPVSMNGQTLRLAVDTGAHATAVYRNAAAEWDKRSICEKRVQVAHSGGMVNARQITLSSLEIGGTRIARPTVVILDAEDSKSKIDGFLATASLRLARLHFDFQRQALSIGF